jgi:membrane fusion protein (multidrug efflux system)
MDFRYKHFLWLFYFTAAILIACKEKENMPSPPPANRSDGPGKSLVDGYIVENETLEAIVYATGSLLPNESVSISPERPGKLQKILFHESAYVQKGQLLAKIDDEELVAQLEKLHLQKTMAAKEEKRGKELLAISAISQEQYDQWLHTLEQIQADIHLLKVQIEKTNIRAPFSGLLGLRNISLGAYVNPSQSLVELRQLNPLKLEFDVPEKFMQEIRVGQQVTFEVVGFKTPFTAEIYALSPEISPTTRSFKVRARCPNPNRTLKPGNFAKIEVVTGINKHATMVPTDAIIPVIDGQEVFVIQQGRAETRAVITGNRKGIMIEIVEGLEAGDTVIISGLLSISNGAPVGVSRVVDYKKALH